MAWNNVPGSIRALGEAIGILNYLQRRTIIEGERLFDRNLGHTRIVDVTFDNLNQEIVVQEDARNYQPVRAGRKRSKQQITSLLQAAGAQNIDGTFGIERRVQRDNSTSVCDRCYCVNQMKKRTARFTCIGTHTIHKCEPANGTKNQCQACFNHGLPCTWSGREIYVDAPAHETVRFLQAIWFPAALSEAAVSMGSRNLNFGPPNEPTPTSESEGVVQQASGYGPGQQMPSGTPGQQRRTSFSAMAPVAGPSSRHGSGHQQPSGTSGHQKRVSIDMSKVPAPPAPRSGQRPVSAVVSGHGSGQQPPSGPSGHRKSISIDMSKVPAPPAHRPGQRPAIESSQALVTQGQTNLPPVQMFNAVNIDNLLRRGRREDITAAARSVSEHANRNNNLATYEGARAALYVDRIRRAAQERQNRSEPMSQDDEWFGGIVRGLNSVMIGLTDTFTLFEIVDEDGRPIFNRAPAPEEVQLYINRMAGGDHDQGFLRRLWEYCVNIGVALSRSMQPQQVVIANAMRSSARPPFAQPQQRVNFRQPHLLPRNDAYTGPVRPTVPGSVPYLRDDQGNPASSHHVITQTALRNVLAMYTTRASEGSDTAQVEYNIRTVFRHLRNLYHMTASQHLLVIADHVAQVYESGSGINLWNTFPDDKPSNMFD